MQDFEQRLEDMFRRAVVSDFKEARVDVRTDTMLNLMRELPRNIEDLRDEESLHADVHKKTSRVQINYPPDYAKKEENVEIGSFSHPIIQRTRTALFAIGLGCLSHSLDSEEDHVRLYVPHEEWVYERLPSPGPGAKANWQS